MLIHLEPKYSYPLITKAIQYVNDSRLNLESKLVNFWNSAGDMLKKRFKSFISNHSKKGVTSGITKRLKKNHNYEESQSTKNQIGCFSNSSKPHSLANSNCYDVDLKSLSQNQILIKQKVSNNSISNNSFHVTMPKFYNPLMVSYAGTFPNYQGIIPFNQSQLHPISRAQLTPIRQTDLNFILFKKSWPY